MNTPISYYSYSEEGLKNGSFARRSKYGLGLFTLGDFMGMIEKVPDDRTQYDAVSAETTWIPQTTCPHQARHSSYPGKRTAAPKRPATHRPPEHQSEKLRLLEACTR